MNYSAVDVTSSTTAWVAVSMTMNLSFFENVMRLMSGGEAM